MSVKIALLDFGTVASGVPFLLKENHEKITQAAQDEIEIAKVLVRDDAEKEKLQAAGHDYNFVTNVDEIIEDKVHCHRGRIDGSYRASEDLITVLGSRQARGLC